jgi:hypothetical protein|nr:MAG TPA: hypothetical protein [Caudoviricetes sp.]
MSISAAVYAIDELTVYNAINDYKLYGKDSYVFKNKALLESVYNYTEISMNDSLLIGDTMDYFLNKNIPLGRILSYIKGIDPSLGSLPDFNNIDNGSYNVGSFAKSPLIDALNNDAMFDRIMSVSKIMDAIITVNPYKILEILLTPKYLEKIFKKNSNAGKVFLKKIGTHPVFSDFVINNSMILNAIYNSDDTGSVITNLFGKEFLDILVLNKETLSEFVKKGIILKSISTSSDPEGKTRKIMYEHKEFAKVLVEDKSLRDFIFGNTRELAKEAIKVDKFIDMILNNEDYFSKIMTYPRTYVQIFTILPVLDKITSSYPALKVISKLSDDVLNISCFNTCLYARTDSYKNIFETLRKNRDRITIIKSNAIFDTNIYLNNKYTTTPTTYNKDASHSTSNPPGVTILRITGITKIMGESFIFKNLERDITSQPMVNNSCNTIKQITQVCEGSERVGGVSMEIFIFGSASLSFSANYPYPHSEHYILN